MSMETSEASRITQKRLVAFPPDAERGSVLYANVKERLADTFRQLFEASRAVAEIDEPRFANFLEQLGCSRHISPRFFGIYFDILDAIARDDIASISTLFAELNEVEGPSSEVVCRNLTDDDLGIGNVARYKRWADTDRENPLHLNALTLEEFVRISALAREAFALLDAGAPEVSGEIRSLLEEVVFAKGDADEKFTFHGISSFCLWGAILMNAEGHKTELEVLQTLTHESSHMHLFGVALDSPLVLNDEGERYKSPLRFDPRPMDGIYHAVYVSARMHYALSRLLAAGVLSPAQVEEAQAASLTHIKSFREGLATIEAQGRLTELGHDLMSEAKSYMLPYLSA
jgi:hypothetical protein